MLFGKKYLVRLEFIASLDDRLAPPPERPSALAAAVHLAVLVNRVASRLKGRLPSAFRAFNRLHIYRLVFLSSCILVFLFSSSSENSASSLITP